MLLVYLWGIETIWNTLKEDIQILLLVYLWGIETAYRQGRQYINYLVISLPMRNWNHWKNTKKWVKKKELLVYLWGIETPQEPKKSLFFFQLLVYLWGIETTPEHINEIGKFWLLVYLWGIETLNLRMKERNCWLVISLPMRNWNTVFKKLNKL